MTTVVEDGQPVAKFETSALDLTKKIYWRKLKKFLNMQGIYLLQLWMLVYEFNTMSVDSVAEWVAESRMFRGEDVAQIKEFVEYVFANIHYL